LLEQFAKHLPPGLARFAKRYIVFPRYAIQAAKCRRGYLAKGEEYRHRVLFIAGLPKSGTTWMKKMLCAYPGFHEILIPDVASYELLYGDSHSYELPLDIFHRLNGKLVVTKMHIPGSVHNLRLFEESNIRHLVLYRDPRDVAISHYFYVRQTPWHPEFPIYRCLSVEAALMVFADRSAEEFAEWVRKWETNAHPRLSLIVRYEDLLQDTEGVMTEVARHFGLDSSKSNIRGIVNQYSFERLSRGRQRGEGNAKSFFRKGVRGDWKNYFTREIKEVFKERIGDFLIDHEYVISEEW
jgi:hypothetical protein